MNTYNSLPPQTRERVIGVLLPQLATALDLTLQMKQAHWNVRGPAFQALHELFDEISDQAEEAADLIAERCRALGGDAPGAPAWVAANTRLAEAKIVHNWRACVEQVAAALARFATGTREAIGVTDEMGDPATADMFTQITREADKGLWFVESHLRGE